MLRKVWVWTVLAGMILGGTANATILSTGVGSVGVGSECNVANVGTKPVTVKSVTVIDATGAVRTPMSSNCTFPNPISPGLDCSISVAASTGAHLEHLMRCVIDTSGKSSIRATMSFFDAAGNLLAILEAH
jgi:hypothetical protein